MTFGFSPCPNDTFMFAAIVNQYIDLRGYTFDFHIEDVAALNQKAAEQQYDITKISYNAFMQQTSGYQLMNSGSALGYNCGPLLISAKAELHKDITECTVAIPGQNTTANLLLSIAYPELKQKKEMLFSEVEEAVVNGDTDLGLIIHENRFTYQEKGLHKVRDLGEYWESEMNAPIPLGGIAIKRSIDQKTKEDIQDLLRESIQYAFDHPEKVMPYVARYAQEMDEEVMKAHIALYVNQNSLMLDQKGMNGIDQLKNSVVEINSNISIKEPIFV